MINCNSGGSVGFPRDRLLYSGEILLLKGKCIGLFDFGGLFV